jgi:hypothetical protein
MPAPISRVVVVMMENHIFRAFARLDEASIPTHSGTLAIFGCVGLNRM